MGAVTDPTPGTVRTHVYETETLTTVVDRVGDDDDWTPYYVLPVELVEAYGQTEKAYDAARDAITDHIGTHRLTEVDPQETTP